MVRGVKAGKLCGTIAGLPCLGLGKPASSEKEVEEEGKDQGIRQALAGGLGAVAARGFCSGGERV